MRPAPTTLLFKVSVSRGPLRALTRLFDISTDNMRLQPIAFGLVAYAGLASAIPTSSGPSPARRSVSVGDCPGYQASNVVHSDSGLTADLTLAGNACDVYGTDLKDLKLVVEHQSGKSYMPQPGDGRCISCRNMRCRE